MTDAIHPAPREFTQAQLDADPILRYFHYLHLPPVLQAVSGPFCALAEHVVTELPRNAERTVALRKLLEAKDAAVRANVGALPASKPETFYNRLLAESKELEERYSKLVCFMGLPGFYALPEIERQALEEQAAAMDHYRQILGQRIGRLGTNGSAGVVEEKFETVGDVKIIGGDKTEEPIPFS